MNSNYWTDIRRFGLLLALPAAMTACKRPDAAAESENPPPAMENSGATESEPGGTTGTPQDHDAAAAQPGSGAGMENHAAPGADDTATGAPTP